MGIDPALFWENLFLFFIFSVFKILFPKIQPELMNTMLLVDSKMIDHRCLDYRFTQ